MTAPARMPRVWALSDLHWSTARPMERYNEVWVNHEARLEREWRSRIHLHDLVLVPGDITFARDPHDDLARLHNLPGQKVLVPGNHDHWAQGISRAKLNALLEVYPTLHMLSHAHPSYETGPHLIVGYKGAEPPDSPSYRDTNRGRKHHDKAISNAKDAAREAAYVRTSEHHVIVMTHYPPSLAERQAMASLNPDLWLHGHSHTGGLDQHVLAEWSQRQGPPQLCISSDYLNFRPIEVTGAVVHPHV